jgi:hypothetical protein
LEIDEGYLDKHRLKTGIEGSWSSYFMLLKSAFESNSLSLQSEEDEEDGSKIILLKVHYPLMVGARITGTFDMSDAEIKGTVRH